MRNVLRRAQTAQGSLFCQFFQGFLTQNLHHVGVDDTGRHTVDPNVGGGQFHSQRTGEGNEGSLGAGVCYLTAGAPQSPHGGNIDDAAPLLVKHMGQDSLNGIAGFTPM